MRTLVKAQCGTPDANRFFFDDIFGKEFFNYKTSPFVKNTPSVNVKETEKEFSLEFAAPGLEKEDFKIEFQDGVISISAEKQNETNENGDGGRYTRKEFSFHSFKRSFTIDEETVNTDEIVARYNNGVLYVSIPKKVKSEEEKKAKTISIQ